MVWGEGWELYHERSVAHFYPPTSLRSESLFGFSSTYDLYNKRLIISAPKENDFGEVYECELSDVNNKSCSKIMKNITREAPSYVHDYWFGASVKAGDTYIMACTPRYARIPDNCTLAGTFGRCYVRLKNETSFSLAMHPSQKGGIPKNNYTCTSLEKAMDSLGWSLDIGEDKKSIIVGGLGLYETKGLAAVGISGPESQLLNRIITIEQGIYNFGYSVATGYFMNENKVSFAVSTTYGTKGPGQVYFYNNYKDKYVKLDKHEDIDVVGSMFGAVLCAAKLNQTAGKVNDLLVGAPTYAEKSGYNIGAVYVYIYSKPDSSPIFRRKIVGQMIGSMFGSAIITVGDLTGDKEDEIAIGAPFEDINGVVYLYSGAALLGAADETLMWLQRIVPSDKTLMSFGYSLAALQDYDENGCNELAVSAPFNNTVKLYKCLAAVTITSWEVTFPEVKNRTTTGQTNFVFEVCMNIQYPEKLKDIKAEFSTDVSMKHAFAYLNNPNGVYNTRIKLRRTQDKYCNNVAFVLPANKDYSLDIEYDIETKLLVNPMNLDTVTGAHVVLSDSSVLYYTGTWSAAECTGRGECISNLTLEVDSDISELSLITGSRDKARFYIKVLNTGEVAYDPCVQFTITGGVLENTPQFCNKDRMYDETWMCSSMKPVRSSDNWEIKGLIVDLRGLTNEDKEVSLHLKLFDRCSNTTNSKIIKTYTIPLRSSSEGVVIRSTTDIGSIINMTEQDLTVSKHFEQIYTITNKGPTNFKGVTSTVMLEKADFITLSKTPISYTTSMFQSRGVRVMCVVNTDTDSEITATCRIDSLYKDNFVRIMISMDTDPNVLTYEKLKKLRYVEVISNVTIHFNGENKPKSMITFTSIYLREALVEWWMLIAAALIGLNLVMILVVILYKSGFLQRKNKQQLQRLKTEIKRQTIRRSMIAQPPGGDLHKILEDENETDDISCYSGTNIDLLTSQK